MPVATRAQARREGAQRPAAEAVLAALLDSTTRPQRWQEAAVAVLATSAVCVWLSSAMIACTSSFPCRLGVIVSPLRPSAPVPVVDNQRYLAQRHVRATAVLIINAAVHASIWVA